MQKTDTAALLYGVESEPVWKQEAISTEPYVLTKILNILYTWLTFL